MNDFKKITVGAFPFVEGRKPLPYRDSADIFHRLYQDYPYRMLLESKDISPVYGRMSLIGTDPILEIWGKDQQFRIKSLNNRGNVFLEEIQKSYTQKYECTYSDNSIMGGVPPQTKENLSAIIRSFLSMFKTSEDSPLGLYGAFSYDFVRLFEDICPPGGQVLPSNEVPDFRLFLYDTFIQMDHIRERSAIILLRPTESACAEAIQILETKLHGPKPPITPAKITNHQFLYTQKEYEDLVRIAHQYITEGEAFEIVFANTLRAQFSGDPFDLYLRYRECNPSPYMFYFDMKDECLVGASPEMMVRYEQGIVSLRPISGTEKRGKNAIEDHENMLKLLNSKKERAELDMLVDLGRNDLTRVCEPGIKVSDYRFVEKYARVMHTVTHLEGKLRPECTAFDALISTLNNGTLTGAPKVRAMQIIEQHEKIRRGYYGGAFGYLTLDGRMDTCITIRTAHIQGTSLTFSAGASIVYESEPTNEYQETMHKASAFLSLISEPLKNV